MSLGDQMRSGFKLELVTMKGKALACLFLLFCYFGANLGFGQDFLLVLHSRTTPAVLRGL